MEREQFIKVMTGAKLTDLTQGCSIFTPPWPGEKSLEVHFFTPGPHKSAKGISAMARPAELNARSPTRCVPTVLLQLRICPLAP